MSAIVEKDNIRIGPVAEFDYHDWNDLVDRSPQANIFHYREALEVQADHADIAVHPLIGYKGQEPIGIFPVFENRKRGGLTTAHSAVAKLRISYLGPALLNHEKLTRRKRERRTKLFVNGCLAWLERELSPISIQIYADPRFEDVRPFEWAGFDVVVRHTYEVDLTPGEEDVLSSFSSDARSNIRTDGDYRVYEGGPEEIEAIISQVKSRYAEQGHEGYGVTPAFVTDLYERLPEGAVRPYACEIGDEIAGGIVALEFGDTVYRWQGGTKPDHDLPVNDLVDWQIMTDAMDRGLVRYDLVSANEERLCGYKAKFSPELRTYYRIERESWIADAVSIARRIPRREIAQTIHSALHLPGRL